MENKLIKIDKYGIGWVITIKENNVTIIKEYFTPCFISYKERLFELHDDFILEHSNDNIFQYIDDKFSNILPKLLEYGKMLDRTKDPKKIIWEK